MHVQYAEIALRRHLEEDRLDAVRLVRRQGMTSVFAHRSAAGSRVGRDGEPAYARGGPADLRLERLSAVPVHDVVSIVQRGADLRQLASSSKATADVPRAP